MSAISFDSNIPNPLPRGRDEKLPPPPPSDSRDSIIPPPPPKIMGDAKVASFPIATHPSLPTLPSLPSFGSFEQGLSIPLTPTSPGSAPPSPSGDGKTKKSNPLSDLIETERLYVDQLTGIIRKVAAAWSRSNLPPPELDNMFRSVESVYKANRSLHAKLKEIGTNPSSPKALGDLLMRWIEDLDGPYTSYCEKYCTGFDTWEPVQSNQRLSSILANFSASNPPPLSSFVSSIPPNDPVWTLDSLFLLPKARLKYYRKLYNRLLKSTTSGRSDHRLLVGALDKLDRLLSTLDSRASLQVGSSRSPSSTIPVETEDEVVIDMRAQSERMQHISDGQVTGSSNSSARGSSLSSRERFSGETVSTSISRGSTATLSMPIIDLERRLATDKTLDIFTMKPKSVKLQMAPPSLTYTRELRCSADVIIRLTPRSTGAEIVHRQGHVFLLSDLFLVCERMAPEERARESSNGPDMWLCYPPLSGKVLRVTEVPGQDNAIQVTIMRKETLILQTESKQLRNAMITDFKDCIEFATSVLPSSKQPPPPMPPLPNLPRSPSAPLPVDRGQQNPHTPSSVQGHTSGSMSPRNHRSSSPVGGPLPMTRSDGPGGSPRHSNSQPRLTERVENPNADISHGMSNLVLSPEAQVQQGAQRVPSLHNPLPGPMYPMRSSAHAFLDQSGQPLTPGQTIPPKMASVGPGSVLYPNGGQSGPSPYYPPSQRNVHPTPNITFDPQSIPRQAPFGHPQGRNDRPPSDLPFPGGIRKSASSRSLASQYDHHQSALPPVPLMPGGLPPPNASFVPRSNSFGSLHAPQARPPLPSVLNSRQVSMIDPQSFQEPSPPNSPTDENIPVGPVTSTISAQMKCKVFLKQHHAIWKSLGSAKLKLYHEQPTNVKQLVVEADNKNNVLISTIVLTDGVERVGKTGVAIELSDKGVRTGIVYMIQLRTEESAGGLFDSLLAGSDRSHKA